MATRIVQIPDQDAITGSKRYFDYSGTISELLALTTIPWEQDSVYKVVKCSDGTVTVEQTTDEDLIREAVTQRKVYPALTDFAGLTSVDSILAEYPNYTFSAECTDGLYNVVIESGGAVKELNSDEIATSLAESGVKITNAKTLLQAATQADSSDHPVVCIVGDSITQNTGAENELSGFPRLLKNALDIQYGMAGFGFRGYQEFADNGTWLESLEGTNLKTWVGSNASTSVTFKATFSKATILYATKSGASSFNVTIDGANTNIDCDGADSYHNEIVVNLGVNALSHTVTINPPVSGEVYFEGIVFETNAGGVVLNQLGHPGIQAVSYKDRPNSIKATIEDFSPVLTVISLGTNDFGQQASIADYKSALTQLVNSAKISGGVVIVSMPDANAVESIEYSEYVDAAKEVASATESQHLDIYARWNKSFAWADANGLMADNVHPSQAGHNDIARALGDMVGGVFAAGLIKFPSDGVYYDGRVEIETNDVPITINTGGFGVNQTVGGGVSSVTVSLTPWQANSGYAVFVTPSWVTSVAVTSRSYNQFVVEFSDAPASSESFDWQIRRY